MIAKGIRYAATACAGIAGAALLALVALLVGSTISRYLAGVPLADVEDLAGLLFVAIAFLPMAEADLADRQLRVQFVVRLLPSGWQRGLRVCADGLTVLVAGSGE